MKRIGVFNDTSVLRHHGCFAVMTSVADLLDDLKLDAAFYWPVGIDWRNYKQVISEWELDGIIVNGEGSIHNSVSRDRARYLVELAGFAKHELAIPAVLLNATLHNIDVGTFARIAEFDLIFVRETYSQRYLEQHGVKSDVVPDLSFFSIERNYEADREDDLSVVIDSVMADAALALEDASVRCGSTFIKFDPWSRDSDGARREGFWARLTGRWRREMKVFFPLPPIKRIMKESVTANENFEPFVNYVRTSQRILSGRFHAMTLAIAVGTPVFAVPSNTPKVSRVLFDVFGNTARCLPIEAILSADFCEFWRKNARFSKEERKSRDRYLASADVQREKMLAKMGDVF